MVASSGFSPFGSTLLWNNTPLLELTRVSPTFGTVDEIDISNNDSADATEEMVPGIIRVGTVDVEGNLVPSDNLGQITTLTDLQGRTERAMAVILPAGKGMMTFTGNAVGFKPTLPYDGKAGVAISYKAVGKTTLVTTPAADTHIAIQPTAAAGTIYVNGVLTGTGAWTGNIAVAAGSTKLLIVEAREANKASKLYRIYVERPSV